MWRHRYVIISITSGTDPTNQLWYMPISALPVNATTGALDFSRYDMRLPTAQRAALPITKLVADFRAAYGIVASQGPLWTLQTTLSAPAGRCAPGRYSHRFIRLALAGTPVHWTGA